MNSPSTKCSPSYRNLHRKNKHSPVELKEKLRKDYRDKLQNCRNMLLNRFRGTETELEIRDKLTEIYNSMFDFSPDEPFDVEEQQMFETISNELVQEEFDWWIAEYEKSNLENVDWSQVEQENNVICPICQKTNLLLHSKFISCANCRFKIQCTMNLAEIKDLIYNIVEKHDSNCSSKVQFTIVTDVTDVHIYLICDSCLDMQLIL